MFNLVGNLSFAAVVGSEVEAKQEKKCEPIMVNGKKLKPCCACPETKRPRDECIIEKGEAHCGDLIEAHKVCMRNLGFKI